MAALDTNVLVRYLVQDDAAQLAAATKLIRKCLSAGQTLFVPISVTVELEWVLRSSFEFCKDDVVRTISDLLSAAELSFQNEQALEVALLLFKKGTADFADCVHIALAAQANEQPLLLAAVRIRAYSAVRTRFCA
ncbi:PIN domain-containing protein [Roseateles saccharophilus]|uniref:PIN domain-containing protein n=1 Tax=Roseateles saccharophilus TaxID=304 RepID=UPI0010443A3B|nr:PIN domain-containing protein [Roseateles saccharophilus]MDG0836289.1 PIN domain-containing protein [Roseateles saccharophilus]